MIETYKTYSHTPPHLYRPGAKYFITASTFRKKKLFDDKAKEKLFSSLLKSCKNNGWELEDWVILDNHYHMMLTAPQDKMNLSQGRGVRWGRSRGPGGLRLRQGRRLLRIFDNYWD